MNKLETALLAADNVLTANKALSTLKNPPKPIKPATVVPHIVEYRKNHVLTGVPATSFHHALKIAKEAPKGHITIYKLEFREEGGYDRRVTAAFNSSGSQSVTQMRSGTQVTLIIPGKLQAVAIQ